MAKAKLAEAEHPVTLQHNRMAALLKGESVPNVIKKAPSSGGLGKLWNPYVQDSTLARKGITGAEIGQVLCELGFVKIWFQGNAIPAGTKEADQPHWEILRKANATYQAVKDMPSRAEFFQLVPTATELNALRLANA